MSVYDDSLSVYRSSEHFPLHKYFLSRVPQARDMKRTNRICKLKANEIFIINAPLMITFLIPIRNPNKK